MTFDWAQIAYIGSPLLTPWWAAANVIGGLVIIMWIIAPILCQRALSLCVGILIANTFKTTRTYCFLRTCLLFRLQYTTTPASRTTSAGSLQRTTTSTRRPTLNTARSTCPSLTPCHMALNSQVSRLWSRILYAGMAQISGSRPKGRLQKAPKKAKSSTNAWDLA